MPYLHDNFNAFIISTFIILSRFFLSQNAALRNPLTIAAADYAAGKTYILGVQVTKDGVPYSTDIRFTVEA
jgi:hypothetical protein